MSDVNEERPARGSIGEALRHSNLFSSLLLIFCALLIIVFAQTRQVGIGPILVFLLVLIMSFLRRQGMGWLGFKRPTSWLKTHILAFSLGVVLQIFFLLIVDPILENLTGEVTDLSTFDSMRGNIPVLLQWLVLVWLTVVFLEEIVFRGYLMSTMEQVFSGNKYAPLTALILSSAVFGLAHAYQGISGVFSTGIMGAILALIYLKSNRILWLPILVHGWVDTVGLYLIYAGIDLTL